MTRGGKGKGLRAVRVEREGADHSRRKGKGAVRVAGKGREGADDSRGKVQGRGEARG